VRAVNQAIVLLYGDLLDGGDVGSVYWGGNGEVGAGPKPFAVESAIVDGLNTEAFQEIVGGGRCLHGVLRIVVQLGADKIRYPSLATIRIPLAEPVESLSRRYLICPTRL